MPAYISLIRGYFIASIPETEFIDNHITIIYGNTMINAPDFKAIDLLAND